MEAKSRIIGAFLSLEKCDDPKNKDKKLPVEKVIADKIKLAFESLRTGILNSHLQEVNQLLKEYYVDPSLKNDDAKQLYSLLKIDRLISKENKSDNFSKLTQELKKLKNKSAWAKMGNSEDYPKEPHWFPYHVKNIIDKIEAKQENDMISAEIISMLFMFVRPNEKEISNDFEIKDCEFPAWLEKAIDLFQTHTPNLFNSSVYAYFLGMLLNRHPEAAPHIQEPNEDSDVEQEENRDFQQVPVSKQFYNRLISLIIINNIECKLSGHIQTDFSSNETAILKDEDTVIHALDTTLLQRVGTYLLSGSNFKNPLKDWIVGNQRPYNRFRKKLFFGSFAALLYFLRNHERSAEFIEYLSVGKYSNLRWSFTDSIFNEPSEQEILLLEVLRKSFIHYKKNTLKFFSKTEDYLLANHKEAKTIMNRINTACSLRKKEERIKKICSELHDIVYLCDEIDVDFSTFDLDVKKNHPLNKDDIIDCLSKCEQQHIAQCKNDVYLARDVEKGHVLELKNALQYRNANNNLNISILDIFEKVKLKIKNCYYEEKSSNVQNEFTEQDLINKLNVLAWEKLKRELLPLSSEPTPINKIVGKLFQDANILISYGSYSNDLYFLNNDEYWVCAGAGFAAKHESASADTICDEIIRNYLKQACNIDCKGSTSHLDYCSKRFLAFGVTSVMLLSQEKRDEVVKLLCGYFNQGVQIKDRPYQQTLAIMLNILLIQPQPSLGSKICKTIVDTIYNRSLYPQQLVLLENIKQQPFLNFYLTHRMQKLIDPKLEDNRFPSPFCIYLYATKVTYEEKDKKEGMHFTDQKRGKKTYIIMKSTASYKNVDDFYTISVLLNGITWRLVNRDKKNKNTTVDRSVFETLFETAGNLWKDYQNEGATDQTLKLTWATQLLLTSFCNLAREDFFDETNWDNEKIFSLAVKGDYTQKLYTKGYHTFLDATSPKEADEFFMLSSAMRYTSLLCKNGNIGKSQFAFLDDDMVLNYTKWLTKERNTRFLLLTLRYLSFTNFFEKITPETWESIKANIKDKNQILDKPKEFFLPYDEIDLNQLKCILSR